MGAAISPILKGAHRAPGTPHRRSILPPKLWARIRQVTVVFILLWLVNSYWLWHRRVQYYTDIARPKEDWQPRGANASFWSLDVPVHHPLPPEYIHPLRIGRPVQYPRIQAARFPVEQQNDTRAGREVRQRAVKQAFTEVWTRFFEQRRVWRHLPAFDQRPGVEFGGPSDDPHEWAPTLLMALDTLWLMGMEEEFEKAVGLVDTLDFSQLARSKTVVDVAGTNARFLGGLLAAYDLSGDVRLIRKAVELGNMLYKAFDTRPRMPIMRWNPDKAALGERQRASNREEINDMGGMTLEFTRLSLLTGDPKWYDAVVRVAEELEVQQDWPHQPGLWPEFGDAEKRFFCCGGLVPVPTMAAALAKTVAMVGARVPLYQKMYAKAMDAAAKLIWFRPITPTNEDILVARGIQDFKTEVQGSSCALGASMALGSRLFGRQHDWAAATKLIEGCIWLSKAWGHGTMPYISTLMPCPSTEGCPWDEESWRKEVVRAAKQDLSIKESVSNGPIDALIEAEGLPKGLTPRIRGRYRLDHEAIEGVFVLYRMTGRPDLLKTAWDMFISILRTWASAVDQEEYDATHAKPQAADVFNPSYLGPTLRYFYLVFSDPELASLDDFVFNEQAHPIRRVGR